MGIVSFSHCFSRTPVLSALLTPLQTLVGLFGPAAPASGNASFAQIERCSQRNLVSGTGLNAWQAGKKDVFIGPYVKSSSKAPSKASLKPSVSRLKIVRQFEPGTSATCAGRMTISGTMADVCAELDRMAQREAVPYRN